MATGAKKDYYDLLGAGRKATAKEIRTAFRKLARKYHPDLNPGDKAAEEKFKDLQEAYDVLSDNFSAGAGAQPWSRSRNPAAIWNIRSKSIFGMPYAAR